MQFITFRTTTSSTRSGGPLATLVRLAVLATAGMVLLTLVLVGFFVVLPLLLAGGIASYFYLRRRVRRAQQRQGDDVIDAEYTIIDHR
jgi:membrane protein implicated in regulation of membrane protease activity